ncbi:hypothetical protein RND81_11G164900 [Saponaria officinalis]|uniref:Cyclin C-terminal domain-containing protein n=1 Tax=Saponaria officinalis TaxID=3572 RepID=A0AAW1HMZ1_SAPOF
MANYIDETDLLCYENFNIDGPIYPHTMNLTIEAQPEALKFFVDEKMQPGRLLPASYLNTPVIGPFERGKVVVTLIKMTENLQIEEEALFLSINVMDQFFSETNVCTENLDHLIPGFLYHGVMLADSLGQIKVCPSMMSICEAAGNLTKEEMDVICDKIGNQIDGRTRRTTSLAAMGYMVLHDKYASFLLKLTLSQHEFLQFPPSMVAATAVHISCLLHPSKMARMKIHVTISGYPSQQLQSCFNLMFTLLQDRHKASLIKLLHLNVIRELQPETNA